MIVCRTGTPGRSRPEASAAGSSFSALPARSGPWRSVPRGAPSQPAGAPATRSRSRSLSPTRRSAATRCFCRAATPPAQSADTRFSRATRTTSSSAQVDEINTWIGQKIGGIIVLPLDNNAMLPLIQKAHDNDVKFLDYSDKALPGVGRLGDLQQPAGRGPRRHGRRSVGQQDSRRKSEDRAAHPRDSEDRPGPDPRRSGGNQEGRPQGAGGRQARGSAGRGVLHGHPVDAPSPSRPERHLLHRRRRLPGRGARVHADAPVEGAAGQDVHRRLGRHGAGASRRSLR